MVSTAADRSPAANDVRIPSVLVVLVVKDGVTWLRDCLQSLSAQTHPRLGVIAVDNRSNDGSRELLEQALGSARVISLSRNAGPAASLRAALEVPAAREADYVLLLHDDAALDPEAVARLVEAAEGIGIERVGVVGPKVVDWSDPRILREVGRSTDRFGHPYTPLQDGEMDQGQYDRVLEVLFVSSCAMLISREAWQRTGLPDERFNSHHDDLDFCWRARLAGFRVLMTPLARARHRGASLLGERAEERRHRSSTYYAERAALASMLKNYGVISLAWLLPLYAALGVGRLALFAASRRFEDAFELLAAWSWNLLRFPGTIRRRIRAQSVRNVPDRSIRPFMESAAIRIPRWFETAERILEEQRGAEAEGLEPRAWARSFAASHPVLIAWTMAFVVAALAYRHLIGHQVLEGGVLPRFPSKPSDFFHELVSGTRTTGLGGAQAGSPALALLGALSALSFASTALAQKLILLAMPPAASVVLYRSLLRQTGQRIAAVIGAACYGLSAVMLWAFSQGRLGLLVALAVLPFLTDRLEAAFGPDPPWRAWRFAVGTGVAGAVGVAFLPGLAPALGVLILVRLLASRARVRGLIISALAALVTAALVFPIVPDLVARSGVTLSAGVGQLRFALLARLALAGGPGAWQVALFLPIAALISFAVVGPEERGPAWRAMLAALAGLFLAWGSTAGYLPTALSNAPAYIALSAVSEAALVGYGLASVASWVGRVAFGFRQLLAGALAFVLVLGLGLQAVEAARGGWAIGPDRLPPAWPVVAAGEAGSFRILWLGRADASPFLPPGGDPQGVFEAGDSSLRYAITDQQGVSALDVGRGAFGDAYDYVGGALGELLSGTSSHVGAILAPLSVRYVIAETGDLPAAVEGRLDAQVDMDLVPAGGLIVYRNARALPVSATIADPAYGRAAGGANLLQIAALPRTLAAPLRPVAGGWSGSSDGAGLALIAHEFVPGWQLASGSRTIAAHLAFGWATAFSVPAGAFTIAYRRQWIRTLEITVLALLWVAALWITRRPAAS